MALTDQESFGQVAAIPQQENVMVEKEVENYDEALNVIFKRLENWKKEEAGDQMFSAYVDGLKSEIENNKDEISQNAAMGAMVEFRADDTNTALFMNIAGRFNKWLNSVADDMLKATIASVVKFLHTNKDTLATATQSVSQDPGESPQLAAPSKTYSLDEEQDKNKSPAVIQNGTASQGSEDSKATGGAPTDPSTLPQANVEEETKEEPKEESTPAPEVKQSSGDSKYRSGPKKDFVWYKDNHSKDVKEVPREQGVQAAGITEFAPSKAKMDTDNPVPREQGVQDSKITEFNAEKNNKVDMAKPIDREEGVIASPKEYIKFKENYQSTLRAVLRAIKESHEN